MKKLMMKNESIDTKYPVSDNVFINRITVFEPKMFKKQAFLVPPNPLLSSHNIEFLICRQIFL